MTHDPRLTLISQEQTAQAESLGEIYRELALAVGRIKKLEQEVATLKTAWEVSKGGAE